jgi:hypothetical protein
MAGAASPQHERSLAATSIVIFPPASICDKVEPYG